VVGASVEGAEEEAGGEEAEEGAEGGEPKKEPNTYKIFGTLKNPDEFKPVDYVKEIIKVKCFRLVFVRFKSFNG
jgi:hypothetical protein